MAWLQVGDSVVVQGPDGEIPMEFNGAEGIIKCAAAAGSFQVSFECYDGDCRAFKAEYVQQIFNAGDVVVAAGLLSDAGRKINGTKGVVKDLDLASGRYQVDFELHGIKAFKATNLRTFRGFHSAATAGAAGVPEQTGNGVTVPAGRRLVLPPVRKTTPQPVAQEPMMISDGSSPIAEACENAARGIASGETVQDTDISVLDPMNRMTQAEIFASFDQCAMFPPKILQMLSTTFPAPSQIQQYAWPLAMQGRDVIGVAATGSGKTLAFLLPAFTEFHRVSYDCLQAGPGMLVMAPTRELVQQIEVEANRFGKCIGMWCVSMYGGAGKWDQLNAYRKGVHVIVACPGRLNDFLESGQVSVMGVQKLVLDEADRMLDMGFEPQIQKILARMPAERHNMFFTATWPKDVRQLASTILRQPFRVMIGSRDEVKANQDVTQEVRIAEGHQKNAALKQLLSEAGLTAPGSMGKALVFAATKRGCEELSQELQFAGMSCAAIHGDKDQRQRDHALAGLRTGSLRVLVATDVAARGLDIKGVGLVVNYDAANTTEDYVHRIGRTGRAGAKGFAVTFLARAEGGAASGIVKVMEGSGQVIPPELRAICRGGGGGGGWNRWGGGGGGNRGGSKGGGGGGGPCKWCAMGECWTHQGGKGGKGGNRSSPY